MSILYPGSTSDCLAFEGMSLYEQLENGLLHKSLCLFGDNAYLNATYMGNPIHKCNWGERLVQFLLFSAPYLDQVCGWDAHSALGDFALQDSQEYFIE